MRFAQDYVDAVLTENFADAKALFLGPLLSIHYAHLVMLVECGIVAAEDARLIRKALDGIRPEEVRRAAFDGTFEDLFFYVERLIEQACGKDVAGRLHTARSRNDIDMTMYRMQQREAILGLVAATTELRQTLIDVADGHRDTVFPAHTHTQPAQPTTVAHYLLGAIEQLERDTVRLRAAFAATNRSPLGACAITGTGFPIDRRRTAELLGFDGPTGNTYGSIATVDYLLESLSATAVLAVGLGRLLQDLLVWGTVEVGYLRLPDGFVQGSSIMPQKRNPVALEHARSIASKAFAQASGVMAAVHNTPFGDIVDTEDDLQPLVFSAFRDATRALRLVAAAMKGADFDRDLMRRRAAENWITITELADTLTREHGLAFRASHEVIVRLIRRAREEPGRRLHDLLGEVSREATGTAIEYGEGELAAVLSPERFVQVRRTHGGPAVEETARAIAASRDALEADRGWLGERRASLDVAARALCGKAGEP